MTNDPHSFGLLERLRLVVLTFVNPGKVAKDAVERTDPPGAGDYQLELNRTLTVRRGFLLALYWVAAAFGAGVLVGRAGFYLLGSSNLAVFLLGGAGALLFFWATLALQGWRIASLSRSSLPERINEWIFKTLYLLGTLLVVASASWGIGPI